MCDTIDNGDDNDHDNDDDNHDGDGDNDDNDGDDEDVIEWKEGVFGALELLPLLDLFATGLASSFKTANSHKRVHKGGQIFTNVYKYLQILTKIYIFLQIFTNIYKYLQIFTNICKNLREFTKLKNAIPHKSKRKRITNNYKLAKSRKIRQDPRL